MWELEATYIICPTFGRRIALLAIIFTGIFQSSRISGTLKMQVLHKHNLKSFLTRKRTHLQRRFQHFAQHINHIIHFMRKKILFQVFRDKCKYSEISGEK